MVTIVGGALVRVTDPTSISSYANGFWWSVQTITTVGYGDLVPESTTGRATAVVVMLAGLSFVAVTTAAVTNAFVQAATRRRDAGAENAVLAELLSLRRELAELRADSTLSPRRARTRPRPVRPIPPASRARGGASARDGRRRGTRPPWLLTSGVRERCSR